MDLIREWWDEGRAPYAPNDPLLNTNMIYIVGFAPFGLFGAAALLIGLPLKLLGLW